MVAAFSSLKTKFELTQEFCLKTGKRLFLEVSI